MCEFPGVLWGITVWCKRLRSVGGVKACWCLLGNSVDYWGLKKGVRREVDKSCFVLCMGHSFPVHSLIGPWAPRAMSRRSVMFVVASLVDCMSVHEGVQIGGDKS